MKELLNTKIKINNIILYSLIYIYIPIFIFVIGWIKPIFSIPTILILSFCLYKYYNYKKIKLKEEEPIYISFKYLFIIFIFLLIFGTILGWTGIFKQAYDWEKHNGVLLDLTNRSWPVYYLNNGEASMLTYYIGQYLFPSLIGKIFNSFEVTQLVNGLYAVIGLFIGLIYLFKIVKADNKEKKLITLIILLLFSFAFPLSQKLAELFQIDGALSSGHWLINNAQYKLQLSSNIVLLRWVMPQFITTLITICILYEDLYDIKHYVLIGLPLLLFSSLTFIPLIIYMFILVIIKIFKNKKIKEILKEIFSLSNISIFLSLGLILLLYFWGNTFSEKPDDIGFSFVSYKNNILLYIAFIMSFIPYSIILFKDNKKNPLFYISIIILLLLPFGRMGLWNDLVMRVSIVPILIFMILCIKYLFNTKIQNISKLILVIFLLIGSYSSMNELMNSFKIKENNSFYSLEMTANRKIKIDDDLKYNYYTYDLDDNFFYKYLSRNKRR